MAGGITLSAKILGDRKLARNFAKLESLPSQKRVMAPALRAGGKPILAEAKKNAKELRGSESKGTAARIARGLKLRKLKRSRRRIGFRIFTAEDDGTTAHIGLGTSRTPPKPFLRTAYQTKRRESLRRIGKQLWTGLRKEAKRGR